MFDLDPHADDSPSPDSIDLSTIPRSAWRAALAPFHRSSRGHIAQSATVDADRVDALDLVVTMDFEEIDRAQEARKARGRARRQTGELPSPGLEHAARGAGRQVNVRLSPRDHAALVRAADYAALAPTTHARTLIVNGSARIVAERERGPDRS